MSGFARGRGGTGRDAGTGRGNAGRGSGARGNGGRMTSGTGDVISVKFSSFNV